jgi:hypothetical protein
MLKFVIDKFREAPGPLKQARLIVADLAEEVVDLAEHYLKNRGDRYDMPDVDPCRSPAEASPEAPPPAESADEPADVAPAAPAPPSKPPADEPEPLENVDERLTAAIETSGNKRKQEFKVLAILWDAQTRELGPLSAKAISQHGKRLGLAIRHENVRKVIRMRLEKYIRIHTEGVGSGTIYRYEIDTPGKEYFETTYLP